MQIQFQDEEQESLLSSLEHEISNLKGSANKVGGQLTPGQELPKQIIHLVQYGDTLEGLSLQYEVPIGKIRYRNHIEGDALYHLKEIIIPDPKALPVDKEKTEEMLIEQFVSHMNYSEKDRKVARYYLSDTNWDIQEAFKQYKDDLEWEKKNKPNIVSVPISHQSQFQMQEIRRLHHRIELLKKKND